MKKKLSENQKMKLVILSIMNALAFIVSIFIIIIQVKTNESQTMLLSLSPMIFTTVIGNILILKLNMN